MAAPKLHYCASPACPGRAYKASDLAHPPNCGCESGVHVLSATDASEPPRWNHLFVVRDNYQCILEFEPAWVGGWKLTRWSTQGNDDWCGMSADQIRDYRISGGLAVDATAQQREDALRLEAERVLRT